MTKPRHHDLRIAARAGNLKKERPARFPNLKIQAAKSTARSANYRDAPYRNREQRQYVVVQVSYVMSMDYSGKARGDYLEREGANREGERGLGFDGEKSDIDIAERLKGWQDAGDDRQWRIMISPENGAELALPNYTRQVVATMEKDLGMKLEWVAIDHYNTGRPHVHLEVRGVDEKGEMFWIEDHYVQSGLRARAQEIATRELGFRTEQDIQRARERMIEVERFTTIDRAILKRAQDHTVTYENKIPDTPRAQEHRIQELGRLQVLTDMGLAEKTGAKTWRLSHQMEQTLRQMQISKDLVKRRALERDNQRRRNVARTVDDLEQSEERRP